MNENKIFILTGSTRTGKSTRLLEWALKKENVKGIITPVSGSNRVFMNIGTREVFQMEALEGEEKILKIGKYVFSLDSFKKAEIIIEDGIPGDSEWLVIDEIGPLELRGEGFSKVLKKILAIEKRNFNLILVIREKILQDVLKLFEIKQYELMTI